MKRADSTDTRVTDASTIGRFYAWFSRFVALLRLSWVAKVKPVKISFFCCMLDVLYVVLLRSPDTKRFYCSKMSWVFGARDDHRPDTNPIHTSQLSRTQMLNATKICCVKLAFCFLLQDNSSSCSRCDLCNQCTPCNPCNHSTQISTLLTYTQLTTQPISSPTLSFLHPEFPKSTHQELASSPTLYPLRVPPVRGVEHMLAEPSAAQMSPSVGRRIAVEAAAALDPRRRTALQYRGWSTRNPQMLRWCITRLVITDNLCGIHIIETNSCCLWLFTAKCWETTAKCWETPPGKVTVNHIGCY